jgi:ubiquitin-conjugating enzyme E2 O
MGLEDVIRWVYHDSRGPKLLAATIKNVEEALEKSQSDGELDGLTVMSKGACISLRRVLERLRELVE